jgi:membrane-anchored mycosin MYCP
MTRIARLLVAEVLIALTQFGMPTAQAVSPPRIDDRWLPRPAAPTPAQPSTQREVCATVTKDPEPDRPRVPDPDLSRVWQLTRGAGQRVAIIDTGVAQHDGLPHLVPGGDYVSTGDGTQDCDAHGTLVAGILAAVAPDATVIAIRQSSAKFAPINDRARSGVGDVNTMARAVRTAADLGASVINISSVACVPATAALDDRALGAALAYAVDVKDAVIVTAAGNTGGAAQCPAQRPDATWDTTAVAVSPAWYDDYVLAVGSVNTDGAPSAFTLAGPWVDVAARGEAVRSLDSVPLSGTSYAAPIVSGLAALIRARFPSLTARQTMQRLETTAHHPPGGPNPLVGGGTVDAVAAVSTDSVPVADSAEPSPAPVPIPPPVPPAPPDRHARDTALIGAAMCLVALAAAVVVGAARGRLRRSHDVPRD